MTTITTFYVFRVLYPCSLSVFRNPLPAFCVFPQPFLCLSADDAALLCALNNAAASFFLLIRSDTQGLDWLFHSILGYGGIQKNSVKNLHRHLTDYHFHLLTKKTTSVSFIYQTVVCLYYIRRSHAAYNMLLLVWLFFRCKNRQLLQKTGGDICKTGGDIY